ncbi:MAG: apolipoprotein N-acyltransferase [Betaproteobacteria bacterium RBG_16_58_11]|nr:MAG: apolipoprotein N-acyltransferase [Betaproteobacteria bacterium RBG_16_58_11]
MLRAGRLKLVALPFLLGALTVLGYAPFYFYLLPPLTLAWLFHLWLHAGSRHAASLIGFAFGLGLFGAGVSWVYVSMHDFGMLPLPIAAFATLLFCAFFALFPTLIGYAQAWFKGGAPTRLLLILPASFALIEWVRGWLFTGFPWLTIGYSQAPASPLAGYAPLLGVYGVSLLLALSAGLCTLAYHAWHGKRRQAGMAIMGLLVLWGIGAALKTIAWTQPVGSPVTVSLLQGNIEQDMKWREDRLMTTLITYRDLVQSSPSRLIILPETAVPLFYDQVPPTYLENLARHVRDKGGDLIVGLPERDIERGAYYNSVLSVGSAPSQVYRKQHLVPFGEFVPVKPVFGWFIDMMQIPLTDFARGSAAQRPLAVAGQKVAMNICYEDVFGEEIIRQLPEATLLANVSNDAWFGDSIAPRQHLQISQMRALETGRTMLRATNTGMTAIVDEKGRITAQAPVFHEAALHGQAQGMTGSTPYVRWGNGAFLTLALMLLAAARIRRQRM